MNNMYPNHCNTNALLHAHHQIQLKCAHLKLVLHHHALHHPKLVFQENAVLVENKDLVDNWCGWFQR